MALIIFMHTYLDVILKIINASSREAKSWKSVTHEKSNETVINVSVYRLKISPDFGFTLFSYYHLQ